MCYYKMPIGENIFSVLGKLLVDIVERIQKQNSIGIDTLSDVTRFEMS